MKGQTFRHRFGNETKTFWYRSRIWICLVENRLFRFGPESVLLEQIDMISFDGQIREHLSFSVLTLLNQIVSVLSSQPSGHLIPYSFGKLEAGGVSIGMCGKPWSRHTWKAQFPVSLEASITRSVVPAIYNWKKHQRKYRLCCFCT
jgi:hypothetical protein